MCRDRKQENGVISLFVMTEVGDVFNKIQNLCLIPAPLHPLTPPYKHERCLVLLQLNIHLSSTTSSFILFFFSYVFHTNLEPKI